MSNGVSPSAPATIQTVIAPQADSVILRARLASVMAPPGRPLPPDVSELDAMFERNDMIALTARLRDAQQAPEIFMDMNWLQAKLYNGAGFLMAYAYMHDLWRLGSAIPGDTGEEMKQSASMIFVYSLVLISIDGLKCADVTAPAGRQNQLFSQNQPLMAYMRTLPRTTRMTLGTMALQMEVATATVRKNDCVLCSGGLAQIKEGLEAQGQSPLTQVPNAPGTLGKTFEVPAAPGYTPQFVDEGVWAAKQAAARLELPASLTRFLTLPSDTPTAATQSP